MLNTESCKKWKRPKMDHKSFLERFAPGDAAKAFNVSRICISHWKSRGIPSRFWLLAEQIAKEKGWGITAADLESSATGTRIEKRRDKEHEGIR